jgi:prepilin-type N-terminal cleavage/methylation domain-containing protein
MFKRNNKGFSLIELMVTVLILVIILIIGYGLYSDYIIRSLVADRMSGLGVIKADVSEKLILGDNNFSDIVHDKGVIIDSDGTIKATVSGTNLTVILKPTVT